MKMKFALALEKWNKKMHKDFSAERSVATEVAPCAVAGYNKNLIS